MPANESFDRPRFLLYALSCAAAATAMISAVTIAAIATERMLGDATWSGVPVALSVLGTAAGSQLIAWRLTRSSPRGALWGQYVLAALGAAVAASAVPSRSLVLLCCGLFVVGLGNGATQYTRYLAADTAPAHRRGRALSWVVWMGSFGAVVGPNLLAPTGRIAQRLGMAEEAGPFLFSAVAFLAVAFGYRILHPTGHAVAATSSSLDSDIPVSSPADARVATVAMVLGHVVMVWIMTMTPIQLSHDGHGLRVVGLVISAHVAGMYLLAPLVGALVDRFGSPPVMRSGAVVLATACALAAVAANGAETIALPMAVPLFLLGLGWNFGFVGGSARLSAALPVHQQIRGRARADTAIWIGAALASSTSSLVFAQIGFARLAWAGFVLSVALCLLLLWRPRRLSRRTSAPSGPSRRTNP